MATAARPGVKQTRRGAVAPAAAEGSVPGPDTEGGEEPTPAGSEPRDAPPSPAPSSAVSGGTAAISGGSAGGGFLRVPQAGDCRRN